MLIYQWSTLINETMNNFISAYAPKTKNFSGTLSLRTRVGILAGTLALGYFQIWERVFEELGLEIDFMFTSSLRYCDVKKNKKRAL